MLIKSQVFNPVKVQSPFQIININKTIILNGVIACLKIIQDSFLLLFLEAVKSAVENWQKQAEILNLATRKIKNLI